MLKLRTINNKFVPKFIYFTIAVQVDENGEIKRIRDSVERILASTATPKYIAFFLEQFFSIYLSIELTTFIKPHILSDVFAEHWYFPLDSSPFIDLFDWVAPNSLHQTLKW